MFLNVVLRKYKAITKHSPQCIHRTKKKKSSESSNQLFLSTVPMNFIKTEKILCSDIMG